MHRILKNKNQKGFTLIELMIVVAIIGILAAIAIPQFLDMMKSSKKSEASEQLSAIKKGAQAYVPEHAAFPAATEALTPSSDTCCNLAKLATPPRTDGKCPPDPTVWSDTGGAWDLLNFSIEGPHYYQYSYDSDGALIDSEASGDLDCDGDPGDPFKLTGDYANGSPTFDIIAPNRIE